MPREPACRQRVALTGLSIHVFKMKARTRRMRADLYHWLPASRRQGLGNAGWTMRALPLQKWERCILGLYGLVP